MMTMMPYPQTTTLPIADRAVVDDYNNNKVTLPKATPKIPSVESEDISITSADVIPKVK